MVSNNPVDSILLHFDVVLNKTKFKRPFKMSSSFDELEFKRNSLFLKIFLLCATKWSNNHHMFLESNDDHNKLDLPSFLSSIEDSVNKIGRDMESHRRRSETSFQSGVPPSKYRELHAFFAYLQLVDSNLRENIKCFKQEIIKVYITLSDYYSSLQSSCCLMRGDELVDIIHSVLQHLVYIVDDRHFCNYMVKHNKTLPAQIEALEDMLTFLNSFIGFAKLFCIEGHELEHLFTRIQVVALIAARLSYICLFYKEDEE
ncbi:hypothetical protein ACH5RR_028408, partial [Cinchona calisaya]